MKKLLLLIFVLLSASAFADTVNACYFNASTDTLVVSEGRGLERVHCSLKLKGDGDRDEDDARFVLVSGRRFFSLTEPDADGAKFPCSDRVNITRRGITLVSAAGGGLRCGWYRKLVPEVAVGDLGLGADLGTGILALCTEFGRFGKCVSATPVDLVVISDLVESRVVPEPASWLLLGSGLSMLGVFTRRRKN